MNNQASVFGQGGPMPPAQQNTTATTGTQLDQTIICTTPINRLRVQLTVTLDAAADGVGALADLFAILQTFKVYAGTKEQVQSQKRSPIIEVLNHSMSYAGLFTALRDKHPAVTPSIHVLDPGVNGTPAPLAAFRGYVDLYVNEKPGTYYITYDINAIGAFVGPWAVAAPVGMTLSIVTIPIDEGLPVQENESLHVGAAITQTSKDLDPCREFALFSRTEFSANVSALSFGDAIPAPSIEFLEDLANGRLGMMNGAAAITGAFAQILGTGPLVAAAGATPGIRFSNPTIDPGDALAAALPIYVIYKSSAMKSKVSVSFAAATTFWFAYIN
jgi:hypothetical protein